MGLADFFGATSPPPGAPANTTTGATDSDLGELVRRLTRENVALTERNQHLEESYRAAIGARKGAVDRVRELEDVLRLKEGIFDTMEKEIDNLQRQNGQLQLKEQELFALRLSQSEAPLSASDAAYRFDQLADVFSQLKDTLACPVCYEPFEKDQAISLSCGHTFCAPCYKHWEERHLDAFRLSPQQGAYTGPECPECRVADPRRTKVRIWALEEIIRLVDRAQRDIASKPYTPPLAPPPAAPATSAPPPAASAATEEAGGFVQEREEEREREVGAEEDVEAREAWAEEAAAQSQAGQRDPSTPDLLDGAEGVAMEVEEPDARVAEEEEEEMQQPPALLLERERRAY